MKIIFLLLAILVVAFFAADSAPQSQPARAALPPRIIVSTETEARHLAWPQFVAVSGTGSMRPYIPASADPKRVVAIAAIECPPYEHLKKGDLVIYRGDNKSVIHQIVARQGQSWITSGLNNSFYDGARVNRETFQGRVVRVYIVAEALGATTASAR